MCECVSLGLCVYICVSGSMCMCGCVSLGLCVCVCVSVLACYPWKRQWPKISSPNILYISSQRKAMGAWGLGA